MAAVAAGIGAGVLIAVLLLGVGSSGRVALAAGLALALAVSWTRHNARTDPRRRRPWLLIAFLVSAVAAIAALAILDDASGPCNVDDFTGCSSLGEVAVFASIFLIPTAIALGLIVGILFVVRLLKSDD